MNGEIKLGEAPLAKLAEFQQEGKFHTQAQATPLPGPLKNAFALKESIDVGPYQVRAIVDRDFEYLQLMDNPLHYQMTGKEFDMMKMVRGQNAYDICFMFTHPFKEVKGILKSGGIKEFQEKSGEEFDSLDLGQMLEIIKGIYAQLERYWEPVIGHQAPGEDNSKKNTLVDGMAVPATVLDGALKSDVS